MALPENESQPFPWRRSKRMAVLKSEVQRALETWLPLTPDQLERRHQVVESTLKLRQEMESLDIPVDELRYQVREEGRS